MERTAADPPPDAPEEGSAVGGATARPLGGVTVRPLTWADLPACAGLPVIIGDRPGHGTAAALAAALSRPRAMGLLAELDGRIVGCIDGRAQPDVTGDRTDLWVGALAVDDDAPADLVGRALVDGLADAAARAGCDGVAVQGRGWRSEAWRSLRDLGFREAPRPRRFARPITAADGRLVDRFLAAAGAACSAAGRVLTAVDTRRGATPGPELADAVLGALADVGVPVLGARIGEDLDPGATAVVVDPLDGGRNHRFGEGPWATAVGLVVEGIPTAGMVADHRGGRRWWTDGRTAAVDGRDVSARHAPDERLLLAASPAPGDQVALPRGFVALGVSGCGVVDLCRVAAGAAAAYDARHRPALTTRALAAPAAVLHAAGALLVGPTGDPIALEGDLDRHHRLVAAADAGVLSLLLHGVPPSDPSTAGLD